MPLATEPSLAGKVVILPPEMVVAGAVPWHTLYCALKAGAAGVIFVAPAEAETIEPLTATVVSMPCVSISEEAGKTLQQMVGKDEEAADDIFAPMPTAGDVGDDANAVLTLGVGLWIKDRIRFAAVSVGQDHTLALTTLGSVFAWGTASKGRLGLGSETKDQSCPTLVGGKLTGLAVRSVACGHNFSYAVTQPSTLYSWGCNDSPGQLGVGDTVDRWEPCEVVALRDHPLTELAVQHTTTVVSTNDGQRVFAWGHLEVCGKGVIRLKEQPAPVEFEVDGGLLEGEVIVSVAAGRQHAAIASSSGRVWAWGRGRTGRLGLGDDKESVKLKIEPQLLPEELGCWEGLQVARVFAQVRATSAS